MLAPRAERLGVLPDHLGAPRADRWRCGAALLACRASARLRALIARDERGNAVTERIGWGGMWRGAVSVLAESKAEGFQSATLVQLQTPTEQAEGILA